MKSNQEITNLYFCFEYEESVEIASQNFKALIAEKKLKSFSITLEFQIDDFELGDLSVFNDVLDDFFSKNGTNCHQLTIIFNSYNVELHNVVFSKFKYFNNLIKLEILFHNDLDLDDSGNAFQLKRLISYLDTLPAPEKISLLEFDLTNVMTADCYYNFDTQKFEEPLDNYDATFEERILLDFIHRCNQLNEFSFRGNFISRGLYRQLNMILKQLQNLESVNIDYICTDVDLSPLIEILQNQNIKKLTFAISGSISISENIIPAYQLRELRHVLKRNRGLDSLFLDLSHAFESDQGTGFFDMNKEAYLTHEFLLFLKQLCSMVCLKTLKIILPEWLREDMSDEFQQNELYKLFDNIKGTTQVDISFMENNLDHLKEMSLQTSERGRELCRVMDSSEYSKFSMNLNQLDEYPSLLNIAKNFSRYECLQLDINLFYYLVQQQWMLQIVKANNDYIFQHSKLVNNFIWAINEQFARNARVLRDDYLHEKNKSFAQDVVSINEPFKFFDLMMMPDCFNIFKYLDLNDFFSLILTVGGFHQYLKEATSITSEKRTTSSHIVKEDIFNNTRLSNSNRTVNNEHLYTSEDINAILRSRFANRDDVAVMASLRITDERFKDLFQDAYIQNPGKILLFPILINEHWVGISSTNTENGIIIHYYDSLISEERLELIQNVLRAVLKNGAVQFIAMEDPYLQTDYTSCGAYLIENMFRNLNNLPREENITSEHIRTIHLDLLNMYYPLYYSTQISSSNKRKRESSENEIDNDTSDPCQFDELDLDDYFFGNSF